MPKIFVVKMPGDYEKVTTEIRSRIPGLSVWEFARRVEPHKESGWLARDFTNRITYRLPDSESFDTVRQMADSVVRVPRDQFDAFSLQFGLILEIAEVHDAPPREKRILEIS